MYINDTKRMFRALREKKEKKNTYGDSAPHATTWKNTTLTQGLTDILISILVCLGLDWKTETQKKKQNSFDVCSTMRRSLGRWRTRFDNVEFRTLAALKADAAAVKSNKKPERRSIYDGIIVRRFYIYCASVNNKLILNCVFTIC